MIGLQPFPQQLAELCQQPIFDYNDFVGKEITDDDPATIERFNQFLKHAPIAIQGQGGDRLTCQHAAYGKYIGLSQEATYWCMWAGPAHWNNKCNPPWDSTDLAKKVYSGYVYWHVYQGEGHPSQDFDDLLIEEIAQDTEQFDSEQRQGIVWDYYPDSERPRKTLANAVNYLEIEVIDNLKTHMEGAKGNELHRLIRFNQFNMQIEFMRPAPWHNKNFPKKYWEDSDTICLRHMLGRYAKFDVSLDTWHQAIEVQARKFSYHPVQNYL